MGDYFLFENPGFISGMSRVLDLGATLNEYNSAFIPGLADSLAIQSDWSIVGADLQNAINDYGKEKKE